MSTTQVTCTRTNAADTLASGAAVPGDHDHHGDPCRLRRAAPTSSTPRRSTAHTYDPDPDNNDDTDTATSVRSVDLAIDQAAQRRRCVAGQDATYTLDVHNNGPSDSTAPIVVDR